MELTHFNSEGRAQMVDVSGKEATFRVARAAATVRMAAATAEKIRAGQIGKGDVLAVEVVAGKGGELSKEWNINGEKVTLGVARV